MNSKTSIELTLLNLSHIERIIASARAYPEYWKVANGSIRSMEQYKLSDEACSRARHELVSKGVTMDWNRICNGIYFDKWHLVYISCICLAAYEDYAYMLDSDIDELKILAKLGNEKAIMLLPACIALSKVKLCKK